jgi:hypothetical protein
MGAIHPPVQQAGGTVARAKRTDRAEARRRYRATLIDEDQQDDQDVESAAADEAPAARSRARSSAPAGPPPRPSIVAAFRNSFRPLDVRGDIAALPSITIHSKAVWLPVLLTIASAAAFAVLPNEIVPALVFQYFVFSPPIASIFLAGFLAPRASYLTGAVAGLAGGICFAILVVGKVGPFVQLTEVEAQQYIASGLFASPLAGVFFGGAAGWYKRFLAMANPNRVPPRPRPGDRNRRDSNNRPLLARRR